MQKYFTLLFFTFFIGTINAQTPASFDDLLPKIDTFFNGADGVDHFSDGDAIFPVTFNYNWNIWVGGWSISSMTDSITADFTNLYSARPASGVLGSMGYAVGQQGAKINLSSEAQDQVLKGLFITNATYPYFSMKNGDGFAKKFGGETGDDPDFFRLTIHGFSGGEVTADSIDFYLADYRFEDNTNDYIVDSWEYVDLSTLGAVDSLSFTLTSTDVGDLGINTPLFFCIDQFNSADITATRAPFQLAELEVFPNPSTDYVNIRTKSNGLLHIIDQQGRILITQKTQEETTTISLTGLPGGTYWVHFFDGKRMGIEPIFKE